MPKYSHLINYNIPWLKPTKSSFIKILMSPLKKQSIFLVSVYVHFQTIQIFI